MATTTPDDGAAGGRRPERHKREDPARTGPLRDATAPRRRRATDHEPRAGAGMGDGEHRPGSFGDAVTHGVQLGYRVVEEQIRQGQRAAEEISRASYGPGAMGDDLREASERLWRYSMDLGRLWFDFVSAFTPAAAWTRNGFGAGAAGAGAPPTSFWGPTRAPEAGPAPPGAHAPPAAARGAGAAIQVQSRRPVRVALDLRPGSEGRELEATELRASREGNPSLGDVVFEAAPPGLPPTVCIRVPDEQPPDTYLGVVVDRHSGEHLGTLSVSVAQ